MSETLGAALGMALVGAVATLVLKNFGWRGAGAVAAVSMLAIITLFSGVIFKIAEGVNFISGFSDISEYARGALKVVGVGYISGICSDVCIELGESGISKAVLLSGKLEVVMITIPYFQKMVEAGIEFLT